MNSTKYIHPNIVLYNSDDLNTILNEKEADYRRSHGGVEDVLDKNALIVFGEPGFGKSRLLKELVKLQESKKKFCILLDLKQISGSIIEMISAIVKEKLSTNPFEKLPYFTKNFRLSNSKNVHIYLDALDEVHTDKVPSILDEVQNIKSTYPNITIIISCRTHHSKRYKTKIENLSFEYCSILPLNAWHIATFIKENIQSFDGLEKKKIFDGIEKFFSNNPYNPDSRSTLNTPRYLVIFISLLKENTFENLTNKSRSELFDLFIKERLKVESKKRKGDKRSYLQKIPHIIQCFERLALVMEIARTNIISKEDLAIFEMDSEINISNQLLMEVFYDGTLLKDTGDYLEFDNTEFQEYLASKALNRTGKHEQVIFDIAIDPKLGKTYPSWINVLSYLVEQLPDLLLPLIKYACRQDNPDLFKLIQYPKIELINSEIKNDIFKNIYLYHIKCKRWLGDGLDKYLVQYFIPNLHNRLIYKEANKSFNFQQYYSNTFAAEILVEYFKSGNKLIKQDHENWKDTFLGNLSLPFDYGSIIHQYSIHALVFLCKIEEFASFNTLANKNGQLANAVMQFYIDSDPNHSNSIQYFISSYSRDRNLTYPPLSNINTRDGYKTLFEYLKNEAENLEFNVLHSISDEILSKEFADNLIKHIDDLLLDHILDSIISIFAFQSFVITESGLNIIKVLKSKYTDIELQIVQKIVAHNTASQNEFNTGRFISKILSFKNFKEAERILRQLPNADQIIFWILLRSSDTKISSLFQNFFPQEHKKHLLEEKERDKTSNTKKLETDQKQESEYRRLIELLDKKDLQIINHFYHSKNEVRNKFSDPQKNDLKILIKSHLTEFTPIQSQIKIEKKDNGVVRKTQPYQLVYYLDSIRLLELLEIPHEKFRSQIINALPFAFDNPSFNSIFSTIQNVSEKEAKGLIQDYFSNRSDNFHFESLNRFIQLSKEFGFISITFNYIKDWCKDEKFEYYDRNSIITIAEEQNEDENFFIELFDYYNALIVTSDRDNILNHLNKILLRKNNSEALDWRIQIILDKCYIQLENNDNSGLKPRHEFEGLGYVLRDITDPKFERKFYYLLEESFKLLVKDSGYYSFVTNEIWHPVEAFYKSLIGNKESFKSTIKQLNELVKNYNHSHVAHWFSPVIEKIEKEYLAVLGKPMIMAKAIQKYNTIRSKQYLNIAYPNELFSIIKDVITTELTNFIHQGFYSFIGKLKKTTGGNVGRENLIQISIVTQLENFLLRRGLRPSDMTRTNLDFYREVEKSDGKKVDLIINYGAIGSVMIEIKRAGNTDLNSTNLETYKNDKFLPYMTQTNCEFGIFLIFLDQEKNRTGFERALIGLKNKYDQEANIAIIGIECLV